MFEYENKNFSKGTLVTQLLNIMKLQSVFYIQYSQHKLKNVSKRANKYGMKNAFIHQQPKYFKNTTFLVG